MIPKVTPNYTSGYSIFGDISKGRFIVSCGNMVHTAYKVGQYFELPVMDIYQIPIHYSLADRTVETSKVLVLDEQFNGLGRTILDFNNLNELDWDVTILTIEASYELGNGSREEIRTHNIYGYDKIHDYVRGWMRDDV